MRVLCLRPLAAPRRSWPGGVGLRPVLGLAVLLAALLTGAGAARADRSFDLMLSAPAVDAYGLTVVDRAQTPQRFEFGFSAQLGWSYSPLRLTLTDPKMTGSPDALFRVVEQQYNIDLGVFLGLTDWLSIAAALPIGVNFYDNNALGSANQEVLPSTPTGMGTVIATGLYAGQPRQNIEISQAGPRDPRLSLKARFYGGRWFEIGLLVEGSLPIGNSASFLGEKSATLRPRLLTGILLKRVVLALSVGAIVRETNELYDPYRVPDLVRFQVGHELTWGGGLTVKAHQVIGFGVEAVGTVPLVGDTATATALVLGSIYLQPTPKLKLILSGGGGVLQDSPRNADGRAILGFAYSLSPRAGGLL